jgi:hypothetical protein
MSFPWEARVPVSPGSGRQTEMTDKVVGKDKKSSGATTYQLSFNIA